ncbi:hypothetical protein HMPREF1624_01628 [Sporothrix schenckii ATCC 58251]|uniref:Beta-lactamase-related domain-containing protein n=1 Tax=Sporothrix schenckii (strain ATCC 58251 / de Perez 2211183) TaxID=1391915 RepID=U7Q7W2_SPOS1|nr:hypothetical protein HMPREF1624_01628 [Sporothrix schenckii ATCC 58251]
MATLDEYLATATSPGPARTLPGCVMIAYQTTTGQARCKSFGTESVDPSSPRADTPLSVDSCMWVASCTKLMTAIAALQCVEKGLLMLDDDISLVLPEWKEARNILRGFDDATGAPLLEPTTGPITLRMLLTQCSGLAYAFMNESFQKYIKYQVACGWKPDANSERLAPDFPVPLLFEPGTSWNYGIGTDWAGRMVERATGLTLGEYMDQYIWQPLGMTKTTFRILDRPDICSRMAQMSVRTSGSDGSHGSSEARLAPYPDYYFPVTTRYDYGGSGVFTSPREFFKVLVACVDSNPVLLSPVGYGLLCAPSLPPLAAAAYQTIRTSLVAAANAAAKERGTPIPVPSPRQYNYALGGMLNLDDVPGGRRAGTISWGGLPNLVWTIDRAAGVATLYASQLLPPGESLTAWIVRALEAEVYSGAFFKNATLLGKWKNRWR